MPSFGSRLLALTALMLLCGCSSPARECPPLGDYDEVFKVRLAGELHGLGEGSAAARVVEDYATLRAMNRVCA